jgi:serine/threonine-protein kinase
MTDHVPSAIGPDDPTIATDQVSARALSPVTSGSAPEGKPLQFDLGVLASTSSAQSEIQALLHRRLKNVVVIALCGHAYFNAFRFLRLDFTWSIIVLAMIPAAVNLATLAVLAVILRSKRRQFTLRQLRWLEGVAFGVQTIYFTFDVHAVLFVDPAYFVTYAERHVREMSILARQPSIIWLTIIVAYGTFIPNTGRRCAAVTGAMALAPIAVITVGGLTSEIIPVRLLMLFVQELAQWLGIGVAIAIYGSHKITVLREEAMAARKLGQYQLKKLVGEGGMGEVYLAEHVLLKRPCAVKVIRPAHAGDPTMLRRFLREVQVTATLTHPNTIQVFDYGQASDGTVYYAMEYLVGLSLEELVLQYGPLPAGRTIFVLRQVCGALAEAHAIDLIHRDIKPSNVILSNRGGLHDVAKLLDFGLVRMQSADPARMGVTQEGMIFGTPTYMSPEQATGKELDGRSDIYSVGALAYFLLTGRPPFVRESVVEVLAAHINETAARLRGVRGDIPEDLEAVVLRCLTKDPEARFRDVLSLERALTACRASDEWSESLAAGWWSVHSPGAMPPDVAAQAT